MRFLLPPPRCLVFLLTAIAPPLIGAVEPQSRWVHPGPDGKLVYATTPPGDRIMDFSYAGYHGGGVALPDVPVKETVQPGGGDDTATLQAAIDRVAALPLEHGFRGAVLLAPGVFNCAQPLTISVSGIVLRGSGSEPGATRSTLQLAGKPHNAITVRAADAARGRRDDNLDHPGRSRTTIADAYVPSGVNTFTVADATGFAVGDTIEIRKPVTAAWVKFMQMDDLTRDGKAQTWIRTGTTLDTERRIAAIRGRTFVLDVPLSDSFDATYLNPPGTVVAQIPPPNRVHEVGIEHLHIESPPQEISHTQPHFTALRINGEDCWARDVVIDETMNSVATGGRRITLERVTVNRKAKHQGASKPAEFAPNASEVLLDRCVVNADNVWFIATGAGVAGPIVVLNGTFLGNARSEAHQRWSTGMLYDNCVARDGGIEVRNRGAMGSGHGWPMAWGVVWNCVAKDYIIQDPPGARNWIIGSIGHSAASPRPFNTGPLLPGGTEDAMGAPVAPRSLYLTQLAERLGPQALRNIGYASTDPASALVANPAAPRPRATATAKPDPRATLGRNLALDRPVLTSSMRGGDRRFGGWQALDNDDATYWATDDRVGRATLELDTEGALAVNALEIGEAASAVGNVKRYKVEGFTESAWQPLAAGTRIGERALARFPSVTVWKVRLTIEEAEPFAAIRMLALYREERP